MTKNQTKSILSFILPSFLLAEEGRDVSQFISLHVPVHDHSSKAGPLLSLMFPKFCRKYLKNWLHSTDLLPHEKICIPQGANSETLLKSYFPPKSFLFTTLSPGLFPCISNKKKNEGGVWQAQLAKHVTLELTIVSLSPM